MYLLDQPRMFLYEFDHIQGNKPRLGLINQIKTWTRSLKSGQQHKSTIIIEEIIIHVGKTLLPDECEHALYFLTTQIGLIFPQVSVFQIRVFPHFHVIRNKDK